MELLKPGRVEAANVALTRGEEHRDVLCLEAPCDEEERIRGRVVEPLRILDEAQEGLVLGRLGEQAQRCRRDEEAVASSRRQPERPLEGSGLRLRDVFDVTQDRANNLVQGGERQVRLRFDPSTAQNEHVAGLIARVLQER